MEPTFFSTQEDFRAWLDENYATKTELLVGFYKTGSGKPSMTWPQSVDQALCYGWIDGVRRSMGAEAYSIRFTPRKPTSIWSAVNIDKVAILLQKGLMQPAGIAAFEKRKEANSRVYAFEQKEVATLPKEMEAEFRANKPAWDFFTAMAPSYKKVVLHWITTAKQEKTRQKRFEATIAACLEKKRWDWR